MRRGSEAEPPGGPEQASPAGLDGRVHHALTDLHAYAMFLEAQAPPHDTEIEDELAALRAATVALHERGPTVD